ncbi:hypothetical protein [Paenibacillus sp. 23TSA30-6]|uniref:hypothetical protein n=1 Tax=Paenibacillus sp. 23TSA30-6 TaxID=2546104 RepID=UPI00178833A7|nr:hypothetical protein [Paenibacillus sp. 23TSA30-6]MBE0336031.1 hypothetical protein [Paenibacillus sp. 23TSA30-6]
MKNTINLPSNTWICFDLPFKQWKQQLPGEEWGHGPLSPILPVPVKLSYVGLAWSNNARLYKNELPKSESAIYINQPYSEYYLAWLDNQLMIDIVEEYCVDRIRWITESYSMQMSGGFYGQALPIGEIPGEYAKSAIPISGVYLGEGEPDHMHLYKDLDNWHSTMGIKRAED